MPWGEERRSASTYAFGAQGSPNNWIDRGGEQRSWNDEDDAVALDVRLGGLLHREGGRQAGHGDGDEVGAVDLFEVEGREQL